MKRNKIYSIKHKLLTIIILLLTTVQVAMAQTGNWDSFQASGYASGSGTAANPYIIKTAEQLAYFAARVTANQDLNAYVELGDDIDLGAHWWRPIGNRSGARPSGFSGHFDGKGYTISNLRGNWGSEENHGFFSFINGGSVKNITFDNAYLTNTTGNIGNNGNARRVGVLAAGTNNYPVIENIIVRNSKIDITKECVQNGTWFLMGGLVGGSYLKPKYANIYVDVDIDVSKITTYNNESKNRTWVGGLLGAADGDIPNIKNTYVAGTLEMGKDQGIKTIGTIVGRFTEEKDISQVIDSNCFYEHAPTCDGTAPANSYINGTLSTNLTSSGFLTIANSYAKASNNALEPWLVKDGTPIYVKVNEIYAPKSKETSFVLSGLEGVEYTSEWKINGTTITPVEGSKGGQITIPLYNRLRKGTVAITTGGLTIEKSFSLAPKYYSIDLYADAYAGGRGTKDDPYLIENDLQLARLAYEVNNATSANNKRVLSGLYFKITKDIDLSYGIWMPIGNTPYTNNQRIFAGKLQGKGHTIDNMRICWTDQSGVWSTWGFFAQLSGQGANESSFCSVSDLIFDHASLEKKEGYVPVGNGMNLAILVGEANPFTEISNIIVKNSVITDNEETYSRSMEWQIGGMVANVINGSYGNIYRIFNLSCDTKFNMLKNANVSNRKVWIGGMFGGINMDPNAQAYQIYPTNLYAHGDAIDASDAISTGLVKGAIVASLSKTAGSNWYYANQAIGSNPKTYGSKQTLADFATTFIRQNNTYLQDNIPSDSCIWVFSEKNGFSFGNTVLTLNRDNGDVITATTPGKDGTEKYYWYVSQDRQTWTQVMDSDGKNPLLQHTLTLPYHTYDLYVYATLEDQSSSSQVIKVEKLTFNAILDVSKDGIYTINVANNIWDNNDKFNITYTWKKNDQVTEDNNSSSYNPGTITTSDKISCEVIITDKTGAEVFRSTVYKATVVYLCPHEFTLNGTTYKAGEDKTDADWGYTPDKPMFSWQGAYSKLQDDASWTENIIVLMGKSDWNVTNGMLYNNNNANNGANPWANKGFNILERTKGQNTQTEKADWDQIQGSPLFHNATITGEWNGVNYNGEIEVGGDMWGLHIFGDTKFENLTFHHLQTSYDIIYCQYYNLEMGKGIKMTNYPDQTPGYGTLDGARTASLQIFGGFLNDGRYRPMSTLANMKAMEAAMPHGKEGFSITLKSGYYSCICAGGRQAGGTLNGIMGTPDMPIKCTITMDIDRTFNDANNKPLQTTSLTVDYDAGIILAGNHEGAMFGDVDIIIKSGKVARVVNGTLGNERNYSFNYNGTSYTPPCNTYMGRANILIDPTISDYAVEGEPKETTNNRVIITELYGGSMGRGFESNKKVDNPFYGYSTVTINGGTFKILPDGNSETDNIFSGIYGAGAGGMTGIGDDSHPTPDERIAYWSGSKDAILYGNYEAAKNNLVTYHCYNADTQTTIEIDPRNTNTKIVIKDGVFGTASQPIDGIYAGGSGYMSKGLWTNVNAIPNQYGGNVYGKTGKTVASLTIEGGEFRCKNGIFAAGRGTDYFIKDSKAGGFGGKGTGFVPSNYKELGKTYGNVEMDIKGGTFFCPIYGGGYGLADFVASGSSEVETLTNMARLYGKSTINISGGLFYKNIYGGGDMALIDYQGNGVAARVNISDSTDIRGSVFGGGNGREYFKPIVSGTGVTISENGTQSPELVGRVIGGTSVSFIGDSKVAPYIYGDIYGGGNLAQVEGDTYVNFYAGHFAGQIFGGGNGKLNAATQNTSADITGNTYVALAQDPGGQVEGDDGKKVDNFSINVIWNKMWDDTNKTFYEWDTDKTRFYDSTKGIFLNSHNIYGGGNLACKVAGSTTVIVEKGMTPFELLKTEEWKASYADNKNPHFYVFGGGFGANTTVGSTNVTVNVEGDYGIYNAEAGDGDEQLAKPHRANSRNKTAETQADSNTMPVFDNSKGIPNFTILGVLGGGYAGTVTGDTRVIVDGNTFLHRVYGGGFGDPNSASDNTTGQVGGNAEVYVQGAKTYGDIFGGGAGVAPTSNSTDPFVKVAEVVGTTKVQISDDAQVFGNVYGGGDIANVGVYNANKNDYTSKPSSVSTLNQTDGSFESYAADGYQSFVNIIGGDIFGSVYGGGKGLKKERVEKYYQVGRINGNTLVHIANSDEDSNLSVMPLAAGDIATDAISKGINTPYIWNRIYGGCAYGTVDGNTLVHIEGGMLGINVFGGGYGDVAIDDNETEEGNGVSTSLSTLEQVLGKKDTNNEGTYANILGNTKVQIDGGSWLWNRYADINGNITRWVSAENGNNKICSSLEDFKQIVGALQNAEAIDDIQLPMAKAAIEKIKNDEDTQKFFDLSTHMFRKNHNIFGGGNRACYVGTYLTENTVKSGTGEAVVEINHSPVADIEDANGNTVSLLDNTTIQGLCWYLSSKSIEHPQFSVFGAGYGANTKVANTKVLVRPGAYMQDNGQHVTVDGKDYRYINQAADYASYLAYEGNVYQDFMKVSKEDKRRYYGSSDGGNADGTDNDVETYVRYRASRMAWMLGTPNFTFFEIHGGGFSGYVTDDTYVETDNYLDCRQIFGAGLGAKPYGDYDSNAKYDFGSIGGNAKVFIKAGNVSNNVYGGGAGIESVRLNGKSFENFSAKSGEAFDFPDMARVNGKTEVHVYGRALIDNTSVTPFKYDRTLIFGSVYGGGDVANVGNNKATAEQLATDSYLNNNTTNKFTSLVNIRGAKVFSHVFAGGNGRKKEECADYTKLGGIYGNACVVIDRPVITYPYLKTTGTATSSSTTSESLNPSLPDYMAHPADDMNEGIYPVILNRVYGGCQNGTIYGNTLVAVNGGKFGANIFGGGWGDSNALPASNNEENTSSSAAPTSADITGNTNLSITGGEMELTAFWDPDQRTWGPAEIINGTTYSPQYDHSTLKFRINHNIYGGGNVACVVGEKDTNGQLVTGTGNTYLTIKKGMLYTTTRILSGQNPSNNFFESNEWKEVYEKIGSPHFGVFGGGYGEETNILGDTHINIDMGSRGSILDHDLDIKDGEEYKHFISGYSVMDFVGGGYSGKVEGETHIYGVGGAFCRRVFGGGFYNSVKATNIELKAIDCHDIFGGGLMGDIMKTTQVKIGTETTDATAPYSNADIFVHGSIYGGNDVSGYVNVVLDKQGFFADNGGDGANINIYGGNINGNVYGAGNGDYLYALDKAGHTKVTVNEYYPFNPNDPESEKVDLVYTVPMRENMPSYKAASDAAKIVNINSWRPLTNKVNISIQGEAAQDGKRTIIKGDVYGGGNSATVQKVQQANVKADVTTGGIKINIGSHVNIGRVFMGCNGDALFTASEDNDFMNKFQRLNGDIEDYSKELNLADTIDWMGDPSNKGISTLWLPTRNENRPLVYPHLLDLYFQPVETDIQGTLLWNGREDGETLTDCTIGTFCCGGNRGNMNVYPKTEDDFTATTPKDDKKVGNVFEYIFPAGLTITDKIVGGCNNANYDYKGRVSHEGGYLLGEIHSDYPFIKLNIRNKFQPTESEDAYKGGNVYGGCYKSGTIRGDVSIVLESDMLEGKSKEKLENSNELLGSNAEYSALNVFGAGYGMDSYVYGNCYVKMGKGIKCKAPSTTLSSSTQSGDAASSEHTFDATGTSANFVYGGGQQGNVIGKTDVKILNGHVFKSVTGGSYSGYVWGSTQIRVGFPKYYTVKPGFGGQFHLKRTDQNNKDIDQGKKVASETIKQTVRLIADDVVTQAVVDAVDGRYDFVAGTYSPINAGDKSTYFTEVAAATPSVGWDNVNIVIGEAVYGGGYSLAQGGSVLANNTTVLKYDKNYNLDDGFDTSAENEIMRRNLGGTTAGFGGNTTIVIGDNTKGDRDHITISRQDMKEANVAAGQDLLGYYYKDEGTKDAEGNVIEEGTYHYIFQAGTYYKGGSKDAGTLPTDMEGTDVYEYDNEGGVFGDGHLSYAEGFRSADLTGYGFAKSTISSPKILNTFQRMDVLRLTDNCFSLLGARDYATNAMDKTPYSISRVNEIQMFAKDVVTPADTLQADNQYRARNYMGFANNIHYVGALYSNVAFTDPWHDGNGKKGTYKTKGSATEATNYMEVKQKYIDDYYGAEGSDATLKQDDNVFEKRNDGTAKNMIGIASGYALKVQNAQELEDNNGNIEENLYYGPVYGVIEMNLIDVREDEGGGYVYADNVHKRSSADDADSTESGSTGASHAVDFLETTGNFVFPYTPTEGRYIVDDCFPLGYDVHPNNPDEAIEAHYWYVTGFNYHYTAHITGYTFNSSVNAPKNFDSNNLDGIVALSGLKASQEVKIASWKLYSEHTAIDESTSYECDLEERNFDKDALDKDNKEHVMGGYTLHVGAGNSTEYVAPSKEGDGFAAELSLKKTATENDCKILENGNKIPAKDPDGVSRGDAKIVFRLEDKVNNTTTDYYNKHLSQPCKATLVLYAPAWEKEDGTPMTAKIALSKLYTRTGTGTNADPYKYTKVDQGTLDANATYYYKNGDANFYQELSKDKFYTRTEQGSEVTWTSVAQGSVKLGDPDAVYYYELNRHYTYTIDLTIDYVQGPDIEGNITIENCALPGERIRLRKDKVAVKADQAFSVTGYYWRIGKREKVGDDWIFNDKSEWKKNDKNGEKGYDTFNQSDSKTATGMFEGCYYDKTEDFLEVPAYYYMNGYGIQLGITMNVPGLTDIIPVPMDETNHLTIHNFHRMDPHRENVNLHIEDAVKRVADEENDNTIADADKLPEPRIYLADQSDLTAFIKYLGTIGQEQTDENGVTKAADERIQYGKHAQFILQNDLNVVTPDYDGSALADFRGTLHGNGHVITGLEAGHCLVNQMTGNVYNFGLATGKITNMSATNGKMANYHCCFEYAPDANTTEGRTPVVYRMDGMVDKTYTTQDFRLGRVAYDLNEYYLRARYGKTDTGISETDKQAVKYVYDYFANGDYQYSHRTDAITGKNSGITYLRTGKDSDLPNYDQAETRHDRTHAIDKARAQGYVAAHKDATTGEDIAESRTGDYQPLFNAVSADADNAAGCTEMMNDFLFWGQSLQSTPASYPGELASREVGYMTNRVYRTAGYYGDTKMDAFYYNAYNRVNSNMSTYVHIPTTTAIDFTCQNDLAKAIGTATGANVVSRGIYYPPMADNAETFYDFLEKNGVTQNLLVYTADNDEDNANDAYDIVSKALSYGETTNESLIKGHHIVADRTIQGTSDGTMNFTTSLLHLVERTPEGENSEGERCDNNDFCAPIPFTVNNHAWYVRKPLYYANDNTGAWEGICLPFTVQKAEASLNGEITHFYGTPSADEKNDPTQNIHSLHHEYWLRGIMSVENAADGKTTEARFQRPGNVGDKDDAGKNLLFTPTGADETMDYTFNNTFFIDTYENRLYNKEANPYYGEPHRYADYKPLTASIPYIVRFPGERYYEFDLSSTFYNNLLNRSAAAQTVTFNAYGPQNETAATYSIINIPKTETMKTAVNDGFAHEGTFAATEVAQGNIYGMNDKGTAFDDASTFATVMPFRTYIIKGGTSAKAAKSKSASQTASYSSEIRIAETTGIDNIESEVDRGNGEETENGEYLIVRPIGGNRVRIESTYATNLNVYSTTGQLYRVLDVRPGTATYSGFYPGIYIFGKTKVLVK